MEALNAYEVLDQLAKKSKMFEMVRDEFVSKDEKIAELQNGLSLTQQALDELLLGGL